jgi:hypothetical protein
MLDDLTRLNDEQLVFLGLVCGMVLAAATILGAVVAVQFRKLRQKELELGFRDELLLRGYSVDEVVRLITSSQPGWSHGLLAVADRIEEKLRSGARALTAAGKKASTESARRARDLWSRTQPLARQLRQDAAPWFRAAVERVNRGAHWLSGKTEELVRKWVTPQP